MKLESSEDENQRLEQARAEYDAKRACINLNDDFRRMSPERREQLFKDAWKRRHEIHAEIQRKYGVTFSFY